MFGLLRLVRLPRLLPAGPVASEKKKFEKSTIFFDTFFSAENFKTCETEGKKSFVGKKFRLFGLADVIDSVVVVFVVAVVVVVTVSGVVIVAAVAVIGSVVLNIAIKVAVMVVVTVVVATVVVIASFFVIVVKVLVIGLARSFNYLISG